MARVLIPTNLLRFTGGRREVEAAGETLLEVIDSLEAGFPGIRDRLVEGDRLRPGLAAAVDNVLSGLRDVVRSESEVVFLPALAGGA